MGKHHGKFDIGQPDKFVIIEVEERFFSGHQDDGQQHRIEDQNAVDCFVQEQDRA